MTTVDIATDWAGVALVIAAIGTATAAVITAIKTARKVDATHKLAVAIDNAVNTKDEGEQTIAEEVSDLHDDRP